MTGRRQRVDLVEIDKQRVKGWPDFHPEDYCHRCGGRNVYSWHAPDEVWNRISEAGLLPTSEIVCPQCFTDLARQVGVEPPVWHLVRQTAASAEAVDGRCPSGARCFPFGCGGPIDCMCTCHAVPDDASDQTSANDDSPASGGSDD